MHERAGRQRAHVGDQQQREPLVATEHPAQASPEQGIQGEEPQRGLGQRVETPACDVSVERAVPGEQPLVELDGEVARVRVLPPQPGDAVRDCDEDTSRDPGGQRGPQIRVDPTTRFDHRHGDGGNSNSHACSKNSLPLSVTRAWPVGRARRNAVLSSSH